MDGGSIFNQTTGQRQRLQHHCRRVPGTNDCKCVCSGHSPCVMHVGKMLTNPMLHANVYPHIPSMQDCCNMCTNHRNCTSWEYSSTNICVLKTGTPVSTDQPSANFQMWSGCRAGEACSAPGLGQPVPKPPLAPTPAPAVLNGTLNGTLDC